MSECIQISSCNIRLGIYVSTDISEFFLVCNKAVLSCGQKGRFIVFNVDENM
jgi:hypothetical protein